MTRQRAKQVVRIAVLCAVLCAVLAPAVGCGSGMMTEEPYLESGDINGAQVKFETNRALADNIAQRHCAEYNRVARFIGKGPDTAYYECDER
jgi:hypothetical protein